MTLLTKKTTFAVTVLMLFILTAVYFYSRYNRPVKQPGDSELMEKKDRMTLLEKIGRHIELPRGEEPTIAAVSDVSKLSEQPFFANAKNGDRFLIYSKAKKAILYRPSTDKIIEVGPISLGGNEY